MIELKEVAVVAGKRTLPKMSLSIPSGCHCVLEGPTGSGKTSLVEAIVGLRKVTSGEIWLGDVDVTHHRPADRFIGYIPQDSVLFSTKTVRRNLSFGLEVTKVPKAETQSRVTEIADRLHLVDLLDRSSRQLSGGERQRVAIGRALVMQPDILLLDEPLSAVDPMTRVDVESVLSECHQQYGFTVLHISHSFIPGTWAADMVRSLDSLHC